MGYIPVVQLYVRNMIYMREINARLQSQARLYLGRLYLVIKRDEISPDIEISRRYNLALGRPSTRGHLIYICIYMHRDCDLGIIGNLNLKESPYMRSRGDKISNTLEIFGRNITLGHRPGGAQLPRISCLELRGGNLPGRLLNHASWEFRNGKASMGQVDAM